MALEERMMVSKAARRHHLDARTLRKWLRDELGYDFSYGGRLALVADIEAVIVKHTAKSEAGKQQMRRLAGAVLRRRPRPAPILDSEVADERPAADFEPEAVV